MTDVPRSASLTHVDASAGHPLCAKSGCGACTLSGFKRRGLGSPSPAAAPSRARLTPPRLQEGIITHVGGGCAAQRSACAMARESGKRPAFKLRRRLDGSAQRSNSCPRLAAHSSGSGGRAQVSACSFRRVVRSSREGASLLYRHDSPRGPLSPLACACSYGDDVAAATIARAPPEAQKQSRRSCELAGTLAAARRVLTAGPATLVQRPTTAAQPTTPVVRCRAA